MPLESTIGAPTTSQGTRFSIVLACDESYAMPLATTLRSLADHNRAHWPLDVAVLTDQMSSDSKTRVAGSLPACSISLRWVDVDLVEFKSLGRLNHVSLVTYARLRIPDLFADCVSKVLYLDSDLLILGDLGALWNVDLHGTPIAAVEDYHVEPDLRSRRANLAVGVPRVNHYFNAGVLLIDLREWRRLRVSERAIDYLRRHPDTPYGDQDALNVACDGRWHELASTWNFQNHHVTPVVRLAKRDCPAIVHFITSSKPWLPRSSSVNARLYDGFRRRTQFARSLPQIVWAEATTHCYRTAYRIIRVMRLLRGGVGKAHAPGHLLSRRGLE